MCSQGRGRDSGKNEERKEQAAAFCAALAAVHGRDALGAAGRRSRSVQRGLGGQDARRSLAGPFRRGREACTIKAKDAEKSSLGFGKKTSPRRRVISQTRRKRSAERARHAARPPRGGAAQQGSPRAGAVPAGPALKGHRFCSIRRLLLLSL